MGLFHFFQNRKKQLNETDLNLDKVSFEGLLKKSYEYLNRQQEICMTTYKIGEYQNWYYDQLTGQLTFSNDGVVRVVIDYEEVGSVSEETNTFLWAWDNPHLEERIKTQIVAVKEYGQKRGFEKLITPKWNADQYDGWEMTAISSFLLKAKGAYRVPGSNGKLFSFMIFKSIEWI